MKKLLSLNYSATAFNVSFLILRLVMGLTMAINHGYDKLINFAKYKNEFDNIFGIGSTATLGLVVFAEFFDLQQHCLGGVPGIQQDRPKIETFLIDTIQQHVLNMV